MRLVSSLPAVGVGYGRMAREYIMSVAIPSYDQVTQRMGAMGFKVFTAPYDLTMWGIRGRGRQQGADDFDDVVGVAFTDEHGRHHCVGWRATTDPGLTWLNQPWTTEGAAIIVADRQYRGLWKLGYHYDYQALTQVGAVDIVRDGNRDGTLDVDALVRAGQVESVMWAGLNCHRADEYGSGDDVGPWSAGCQVLANSWDFAQLMFLVDLQRTYGHGDVVSYCLLNEWRMSRPNP